MAGSPAAVGGITSAKRSSRKTQSSSRLGCAHAEPGAAWLHSERKRGHRLVMCGSFCRPHPKPLPRHADPDRWAEHILHQACEDQRRDTEDHRPFSLPGKVHDQEMRTQFFAATVGRRHSWLNQFKQPHLSLAFPRGRPGQQAHCPSCKSWAYS